MTALRGSSKGAALRLGARTPTRGAPVLVPYLPRGAPHAASTRSPSARAVPSTPVHPPGLIRSALGRSTISPHLPPPPPPLAGAASSRQPIFASRRGARPGPAQSRARSPSLRPSPAPTVAPPSRLRLRPSPRPLPPPSPFSRDFVRVRAQASFCTRRGPVEDPPHPLRRADDPPAAPRRRGPRHTHSPHLPHHSPLPPQAQG